MMMLMMMMMMLNEVGWCQVSNQYMWEVHAFNQFNCDIAANAILSLLVTKVRLSIHINNGIITQRHPT
jgi:hypothetical protein